MLEVIYNDPFTTLSLIENYDEVGAIIADSTLKLYAAICYNDYDADTVLELWENSVNQNLELKTIDNTSAHREMLASKSIAAFKKFLENIKSN